MDMFGLGAKKSSKADQASMDGLNKALSEMSTSINKAMENVNDELEKLIKPAGDDIEKTVKDEVGKISAGDGKSDGGTTPSVVTQVTVTAGSSASPLFAGGGR